MASENPYALSRSQRAQLIKFWKENIIKAKKENLLESMDQFETYTKECEEEFQQNAMNTLSEAKLIGITTSGSAKYRDMLVSLGVEVIICEEAAEVLETHIITALSEETKQLVLIGDHLQLRPKINEYLFQKESKRGYDFDVSLFERLTTQIPQNSRVVKETGSLVTMTTQRRMHPQISALIRNTLYPALEDHESVTLYPPVRGFPRPVWFFDHNNAESVHPQTRSYVNIFEVNLLVNLVSYFVRQEYPPNEIAVLTPYLGQLLCLRSAFKSHHMTVYLSEKDREILEMLGDLDLYDSDEDISTIPEVGDCEIVNLGCRVRLSTVDNFQGEEATIVLISTVRCNPEKRIGFLKNSNRVNVMISRAKHGMIILGSSDTVSTTDCLYSKVISKLQAEGNAGSYFPFLCNKHQLLSEVKDVSTLPLYCTDGGCPSPCHYRLECGHSCKRRCHPDDENHRGYQCQEICVNTLPCGHKCLLQCFKECKCITMIDYTPPCGYTHRIQCYLKDVFKCPTPIDVQLPYCSHKNTVPCSEYKSWLESSKDFEEGSNPSLLFTSKYEILQCKQTCGALLPCRHACQGNCIKCAEIKCLGAGEHVSCQVPLKHRLYCGHDCGGVCGHSKQDCPDCSANCNSQCTHSKCPKLCNKTCSLCAELCTWKCTENHKNRHQCNLLCAEVCERLPCDVPCSKKLSCGHPCPSICGEPCPDPNRGCKQCTIPFKKKQSICVLDTELTLETLDEDTRIICLPSCTHTLTVDTLDGLFCLDKFYEKSKEGEWMQAADISITLDDFNPICPYCKKPIRNILRYGRPLNHLFIEQNKRKFLIYASRIAKNIKSGKSKMDTPSLKALLTDLQSNDPMNGIYKRTPNTTMQNNEQPYAVVYREILLASFSHSSRQFSSSFYATYTHKSPLIKPLAIEFYAICTHYSMQSSI